MSTAPASDLILAVWVGPFPTEMPDGTKLAPGDEYTVPASHLSSGHWQPKQAPVLEAAKSKSEKGES